MSKSVVFKHFQNYHIKQSLSPWPKDIWNQALDLMEDEIKHKQPGLDFKLERKQAIHNVDQKLGLSQMKQYHWGTLYNALYYLASNIQK